MKFNRIFLALVCSISLFGVACSDGDSTSSNTPSANNNGSASDSADNNGSASDNGGGETLTVNVPALGQSFTVVRGETTTGDIASEANSAIEACNTNLVGSARQDCQAQVDSAAQEALAFINS